MNGNFSNNYSRRNFIKKSLLGTGIVVSGSLFPQIINAKKISSSSNDLNNLDEGNFPFYSFINEYSFGEFIPKDQGGKFIQMELLGTEKDEEIVELINKEFIDNHLGVPNDWGIFEKTELEKSVWFNRFYYLPSFARLYFIDKNPTHLKFMMELLRNWIKENPVEGPSKSKYNWFDMQVAWRSINLSWCYYLGKEGLTDSDKEVIYNLQRHHAKILMKDFGKKELNEFNHQSHGALAILYLTILFPSIPEAKELLQTGIKIINHHVKNAFYEDGGNVEQMFGYYPFMTSVFRDVYLLFRENNVGDSEQIRPLLKKMYNYLKVIAQPDNTVPPINDSYEETVSFILPTLTGIIGNNNLPLVEQSTYFKDSQIGVIRSNPNSKNSWYINFNAAKLIGSHCHAGRLAFNFWLNNKPILTDSGCCNYDNPLLVNWYRTSEAHNTVLINGKSDYETSRKEIQWAAKRYTENNIQKFIISDEYKLCRMISPETDATNSGIRWTRDVILVIDKYLVIHDYFDTNNENDYETIFRFDKCKVTQQLGTNNLIISNDEKILLTSLTNAKSIELKFSKDYLSKHAENIITDTAKYLTKGNGKIHNSYIICSMSNLNDNGIFNICSSHSVIENGYIIEISDSDQKVQIIFTNEEIDVNIVQLKGFN